ncbi:MAG: proline dehydrogenase family protein, partial [Pirellulales bacterium]
QAFRSQAVSRTAEHLTHLLDVQGIPRFFSPFQRALLRGFQSFGGWLPGVAVPLVKEHMRHETANVVLPAETALLVEHLRARQAEGVRMNLNFLGEALLGEQQARQRLDKYLAALQLPAVEVLSVKISTLYSQIAPHARHHTLRVLADRLELLYREAQHLTYVGPDGRPTPKFIYLDMEEYRDLELTAAAFQQTLDRPGLANCAAGLALQAYIPDSHAVQCRLLDWARRRVSAGGAPITIRLVKGANLEAERVEASIRGWPQAPYLTKRETDANYKRMLHESFRPENLAAARVGIASHNLFDLAYGLVLAAETQAGDRVQFEMLEGMANPLRRALREATAHLLLYAPACRQDEFLNAIGYLLRRLDENTGPENFLRHAFRLTPDSADWQLLERGFRDSFTLPISSAPRRTQNRLTEELSAPLPERPWQSFINEPDTDFSLPANAEWAATLVAAPALTPSPPPAAARGYAIVARDRTALFASTSTDSPPPVVQPCLDPSRPGEILAWYVETQESDVERAVADAQRASAVWGELPVTARSQILGQVAEELRRARGRLIQAALANGGKIVTEADPEVSEAVDFVEFYRAAAHELTTLPDVRAVGRGVVVVVPPWNFPIAIPCGGIAAALAAGNPVIVKPASDAVLVAWEVCSCFWRGGVPPAALQFVPCRGSGAGTRLVTHPAVDSVILTGGTATAEKLLAARPDLRLFAETGGKNATIVTALSDRELAIKHVVHSAFSHSGQKCSATSLLLLEAEVYDDPDFRRQLCDAVESLSVGSAWELPTRVGPLIRPPAGELEEALKTLEPGEEWAVHPRPVGDNPRLWSPGVKYGVTPGSVTHRTEFFGPVLAVIRCANLDEAIDVANATGYGLTAGLFSLDEREQAHWQRRIRAGNLYLNRGTTGAIVLRQPFGGHGRSVFGPGLKAGGPNYIVPLLRWQDVAPQGTEDESAHELAEEPDHPVLAELLRCVRHEVLVRPSAERVRFALAWLQRALVSYAAAWRDEFQRDHDHFRLLGQDNLRRYLPWAAIRVRVTPADAPWDILARTAAAHVTGARVILSYPAESDSQFLDLLDHWTESWAGGIEFWQEDDEELSEQLRQLPPHADQRLRYAHPSRVPPAVRAAAAATGSYIADEPVLAAGRIELLWYLREQSLCYDYHRYGNLGARAGEVRTPPR